MTRAHVCPQLEQTRGGPMGRPRRGPPTCTLSPRAWLQNSQLMHREKPSFTPSLKLNPYLNINREFPVVTQWVTIQLGSMRLRVRSLASLSGWRVRRCGELWCRSQMWLGSRVAVAGV